MNTRFIGDTHEAERWGELRSGAKTSIHVGDVALADGRGEAPKSEKGHWFIRGNKDEIERCNARADYLGDFGYMPKLKLYFISGAASVDKPLHVEQLSNRAFEEAFYEILKIKPEIIVSHDCPFKLGLAEWQGKTATNQWLDKIFRAYQPMLWVFGHHHVHFDKTVNGCQFYGLAKYAVKDFDI